MASSVTEIVAAQTLAGCTAVLCTGVMKIVAEGLTYGEEVILYEETVTEGNYQAVNDSGGRVMRLEPGRSSGIFELYGNHKFLLGANTSASRKVGYVAA